MIVHFQKSRDSLVSLYNLSKSSNHSVVTGNLRENFAKTFLSEHLGSNISWSTGQLIGYAPVNQLSGQLDIILHSTDHPRFYFYDKYIKIVPSDAAIAIIEIKSDLTTGKGTSDTLTQALDSLVAARGSSYGSEERPARPVPFLIVSFHSQARPAKVVERIDSYLLERALQPSLYWPDAIISLSGPKAAPEGFGFFKASAPVLFPREAIASATADVPLSAHLKGLSHTGIHIFQCDGIQSLGVFVSVLSNLANQFEADDFSLERYLYDCGSLL